MRYTYEGDAELQHIKVIGGNHTWYHSESQYDIGYMTEIRRFFTTGNGVNDGLVEPMQTSLLLWPNPTSGPCTIQSEAASSVKVFDLQGRIVATFRIEKGENRLDLSGFPEGLYLIKSEEGTVRKVLVKQ